MDEGEAELLRLIYTRIGTIMEDAGIIALKLGGPGRSFEPSSCSEVRKAAKKIAALSEAANALRE